MLLYYVCIRRTTKETYYDKREFKRRRFWNVRNSRGRLFGEFRNVKMNGVRFLGTLEHRSTEPKVNLHMCVYGLTLSAKVGDVVSVCVLVRALASTE